LEKYDNNKGYGHDKRMNENYFNNSHTATQRHGEDSEDWNYA